MEKLRKEPKPLSEFRPRGYKADFVRKDAEDGTWTDSDEEEEVAAPMTDEWGVVPEDKRQKRGKLNKAHYAPEVIEEKDEPEEEIYDNDDLDNEEEGGEWVNETNLYKHISHQDTASLLTEPKKEGEGEEGEGALEQPKELDS